jgi:hypothetical protein
MTAAILEHGEENRQREEIVAFGRSLFERGLECRQ